MRQASILIGIGAAVILLGLWMINRNFTIKSDTENITSSETSMPETMQLTSSAFEHTTSIPSRFTCDSRNVSPPLTWGDPPEGTRSFALIMDDPDVPKERHPEGVFNHWVLFNIPPGTNEIQPGETVGTPGANGAGKNQYAGPCPPPQYEPSEHRYFFRLYALDTMLDIPEGANKQQVLAAMEGRILAQAELMGKYKRP